MSPKNTPKVPENQLSLFDLFAYNAPIEDNRPLPIIIADKWKFPLTHVDRDNNPANYIYCAREWYIGSGGTKNGWTQFKKDWVTPANPVMIEVKRPHRPTEELEFVDANGLFLISARMTAKDNRPILDEIKRYLAHAGVKLDEYRLNPDQAAFEQGQRADNRYTKRLKDFGYSEPEIPALLEERKKDIAIRNTFTAMLQQVIDGNPQYGQITNAEYRMFHRTAEQIGNQLGTKQVREAMHPIAKNFCQIAELTCTEKMRQLGRKLTNHEAWQIMYGIASSLQVSTDWIQSQLGMDIVTGQPLIAKWTRENMD